MADSKLEVWQRGLLPNIPPLLQPVAHALLQANEEVLQIMANFPPALLWQKVAGMASPGFHLKHLRGVLDRVFTYARNEPLTASQFEYLKEEEQGGTENDAVLILVNAFSSEVDKAMEQLKQTPEEILPDYRGVGRAALPSTVIGLLFHAAEHTMRHVGQLMVTVKVLRNSNH